MVKRGVAQLYEAGETTCRAEGFGRNGKNNTDRRIEGWLTITAASGWILEPGKLLMIAIRPHGTIAAEFYLSIPAKPAPGPHLLQVEVTADDELLARAAFDLRDGLLFLVDRGD